MEAFGPFNGKTREDAQVVAGRGKVEWSEILQKSQDMPDPNPGSSALFVAEPSSPKFLVLFPKKWE
jgi:hypothetical protein